MSLDKIDKSVTVVFEVKDWDKFQKQWSLLCNAMRDESEIDGAVVSSMSRFDEMERVEQLETFIINNGIDVPYRQ